MTCSKTTKLCGFKSVEHAAKLSGYTSETIRLAYRTDMPRFWDFMYQAADHRKLKQYALINEVSEQCES